MLQKEQNPWVGLASYKSQDASRFFGRETETYKLSELIQSNYCCVLYGKSGAGKTSLIQAGVSPLLASSHYLPVSVKLNHDGSVSYARQIMSSVETALKSQGGEVVLPVEIPEGLDDDSLAWLFFHAASFWDEQNYRIIPAVFIDQFEELFNLTADISWVIGFFQTIDTLLQMNPPERVTDAFSLNYTRLPYKEKPAFRLILSLREDFLARLEDYSFNIPALRKTRIGLASMNGVQALEVIMKPIPGLVSRNVALRILSKVVAQDVLDNEYYLEKTAVDSCMLSLFCTEMYDKAAESKRDSITMDIVEQFGGDIIQSYYERSMSEISSDSVQYLESHLLTTSGFRNLVALEDLAPEHVRLEELKTLEKSRIVRIETVNGTERVQFTHDVLCKVASNHKKAANARKEHRIGTLKRVYYSFEVLVHFALIAGFLFVNGRHFPVHLFLQSPIKWSILALLFALVFFIRLAHHSGKYKSPIIVGAGAAYGLWFLYYVISAVFSPFLMVTALVYFVTGGIWFFAQFSRPKKAQNAGFFHSALCYWDDRPRRAAVLALSILTYISGIVYVQAHVGGFLRQGLLLLLVPLVLSIVHFLFREKVEAKDYRRCGLVAEAGILLLVSSQYAFTRVWYYFAVLVLASVSIYFGMKVRGGKASSKVLVALGVWSVIFLAVPDAILGYRLSALGNYAKVPRGIIITRGGNYPNLITVKNQEGVKGVFMRNGIVIPPRFDAVLTSGELNQINYPLFTGREGEEYGVMQDVTLTVKDRDGSSFKTTSLMKEEYGLQNRISKRIAGDILRYMENADIAFSYSLPGKEKKPSSEKGILLPEDPGDRWTEVWLPFIHRYNPDYCLFLANHFRDNPGLRKEYEEKAIVYYCAIALTMDFLREGGWRCRDVEDALDNMLYAVFYHCHHKTISSYVEEYNRQLQEEKGRLFCDQISSLLHDDIATAMNKVYASDEILNAITDEMIRSVELNRGVGFDMLTSDNPAIQEFVSYLLENARLDTITASWFSLLRGRFTDAEHYSRKAVSEHDGGSLRVTAMTNLIPALFMQGKVDECEAVLGGHAYDVAGGGRILIDCLYRDIQKMLLYGSMDGKSAEYKNYINYLSSYSEDIFPQYNYFNPARGVVFYYKSVRGTMETLIFQDVLLFAGGKKQTFDSSVDLWSEYCAMVVKDGRKGYIDLEKGGEILYPVIAEHAWIFSEGLAVIEKDGLLQVINSAGKPAFVKKFKDPRNWTDPQFVAVDFVYHDGLCTMINEDGKYGLIDTSGKWVLQPEYDYITNPDREGGYRHLVKAGRFSLLTSSKGKVLSVSPYKNPIVVYGAYGVQLWDPRSERRVTLYKPASGSIVSVSGTQTGLLSVLSDSGDDCILRNGDCEPLDYSSFDGLWFSASINGTLVFYSDAEFDREDDCRTICLADCATGKIIYKYDVPSEGDNCFAFSHTGKLAAFSYADEGHTVVKIIETDSGQCIDELMVNGGRVLSMAFSPDHNSLVLGLSHYDDNVVFYQLGGTPVYMSTHEDWVRDVAFSHNGKWFATYADDNKIVISRTDDQEPIQIITTENQRGDDRVNQLAVSADDRTIVTLDNYGKVTVWDIATGKEKSHIMAPGVLGLLWPE